MAACLWLGSALQAGHAPWCVYYTTDTHAYRLQHRRRTATHSPLPHRLLAGPPPTPPSSACTAAAPGQHARRPGP